jgi:hypothetical protein
MSLFVMLALPRVILAEVELENSLRACEDGVDNDGDSHVDCNDQDCWGWAFCAQRRAAPSAHPEDNPVACADSQDNDGDGAIDCDDSECAQLLACQSAGSGPAAPVIRIVRTEATPALCQDRTDNDGDALVDCADPDCAQVDACRPPPLTQERTPQLCGNSVDDDGDGAVDCDDSDCTIFVMCAPPPPPTPVASAGAEICNDGIDNDRDSAIDCADVQCRGTPHCPAGSLPRPATPTADSNEAGLPPIEFPASAQGLEMAGYYTALGLYALGVGIYVIDYSQGGYRGDSNPQLVMASLIVMSVSTLPSWLRFAGLTQRARVLEQQGHPVEWYRTGIIVTLGIGQSVGIAGLVVALTSSDMWVQFAGAMVLVVADSVAILVESALARRSRNRMIDERDRVNEIRASSPRTSSSGIRFALAPMDGGFAGQIFGWF